MTGLEIATDFSGVVSISGPDGIEFERAYGLADRAHEIAMTVDTQLAMASGSKGFTAVAVLALVADGVVSLGTTARSVLGTDLPLIADDVTIEHLLTHRSGIGDYLDEDLAEEPPLKVPVGELDSTPAFIPAIDGFATKFPAGSRFSYCNGGFVVLALIAERVAGTSFVDLVRARVLEPAGMRDTDFLRSDHLPGRAAIGYLDDGRTNVFMLPVLGSGDGGAYTTVADVRRFWAALLGGRLLADFERMCAPVTLQTPNKFAYGTGLWMSADGSKLVLEGADHGVSFRSVHARATGRTATVVSNTGDGAWPVARALLERI